MKKLCSLITAFVIPIFAIYSQAPDTLWTKTYGGPEWEIAYSIDETSDGGFIIAGITNSYGAGGNDIYLIKTDANGDTLWTHTYGSSDDEKAYSVKQTIDGGYIIGGRAFQPPDVWLIKTDENGDTLWTVIEGGIDDDEANDVIETEDGYFVAVGTTRSYGQGSADVYLVETSPNGDTIWDDTFGGYSNDYGYALQETDEGYILATSSASFGSGSSDAWLVNIDWEYEILWHNSFGGSAHDNAYDVQLTFNGGYISAGSTESFGPGDESFFLVKTDSNGDSLWAKVYGGTDKDRCMSVKQTPNGGYIMAGHTKSFGAGNFDWYIVRTDPYGDTLWTKTFGGIGVDECFDIQITSDGGYIIAGATRSFGAGNSDFWLIKMGPDLVGTEEFFDWTEDQKFQIFPNPTSGSANLRFTINEYGLTILDVYEISGNWIERIMNEMKTPGNFEMEVDLSDLPKGIYFITLKTNEGIQTTKMIKL